MIINVKESINKYKDMYLSGYPQIQALAYWKMKHLIEEGESFIQPEYDDYYVIRKKHLLFYYSKDNVCHIPTDVMNSLECITMSADLYDSISYNLTGFNVSYNWNLRYDFNYKPLCKISNDYETVGFDFDNQQHYDKAAQLINGSNEWLTGNNIKRMIKYSAFDPSLWFFVKDIKTRQLVAISISQYCAEVKQTDIDWIFVSERFQRKGCGRYLINETINKCINKSDRICVGGTEEFYRRCGFYNFERWVWAVKEEYKFIAPSIQP